MADRAERRVHQIGHAIEEAGRTDRRAEHGRGHRGRCGGLLCVLARVRIAGRHGRRGRVGVRDARRARVGARCAATVVARAWRGHARA